jgi:hypothetical protein
MEKLSFMTVCFILASLPLFGQNKDNVTNSFLDLRRKGRLRWQNSKIGVAEAPITPYISITFKQNTIYYLGGKVCLDKDGLPSKIETNYNESNRLDKDVHQQILADKMKLVVETFN